LTGKCWHPSAPNQSWKKKCFLGQCIVKCKIRTVVRMWREAVVAQAIGLKTKNHQWFPAGTGEFFVLQKVPKTIVGPDHPPSCSMGTRDSFCRGKAPVLHGWPLTSI
jgi:hypothetical protein